jgi:hypothetical protein
MAFFQQLALAGQCFIGSTAVAGVVIPVSTTTSPTFLLWNPTGSGVHLVLNRMMISAPADGTNDFVGLGLSYVASAGSQIGTGAPVVSGTFVAPLNARLGNGQASKARFAPATATIVAAGTFIYSLGFTLFEGDIATTALAPVSLIHDFGGGVVVPPGVAILPVADEAAGLTTQISLTWAEVPV